MPNLARLIAALIALAAAASANTIKPVAASAGRLVQGFALGLAVLSLAGLVQAAPKEGYTPPAPPSCLDLQHSWDVLDGQIRVRLEAIYGPGYPGLAGLENAILHQRPDCLAPGWAGNPPSWNDGSWGNGGLVNAVVTTSDPPMSVPEPTSLALLGSGVFGLLVLWRRRLHQ